MHSLLPGRSVGIAVVGSLLALGPGAGALSGQALLTQDEALRRTVLSAKR